MKRGIIWILLSCFLVISMLLASCANATTSTTTIQTTTSTSSVTATVPKTTPMTILTSKPSTTTSGNWWDALGKPQYGGEMVLRISSNIVSFDPLDNSNLINIMMTWMETLHSNDWTLSPAVFDYKVAFRPSQYVKGHLAESWEFTSSDTYVVHIRKGIHWQDLPPVNGREFTADDVVYHYHRLFGGGDGFTKPDAYWSTVVTWQQLISVTATDKYTVVFKWKTPNPESITETIQAFGTVGCIEAREAVQQWGNLSDWRHAIGTGSFILKDFISGSSATLAKNPNYWGYDERYPQNKLPYVDTLRVLIMPDTTTALAAMRTGKIDFIDQISRQQAQDMQKTNPEILQIGIPAPNTPCIDPRNDKAPFNDIRVRKAMQMAIDIPTIASSYYGGAADPQPSTLTSRYLMGWGWPYDQWPQDLKDEYAYNPTAAKKLLVDAGYPTGFKTNIVADTAADLDLLQIVKSYFAAVGIDMEIRTMDSASWVSFVMTNHKNDQLAQRGAASNSLGGAYEPLRQLSRFQTGYSTNYLMVSDPVFDAFGPKAQAATSIDEVKQVLRDANERVARQHYSISICQPNLINLCQPWFKGYNGQYGLVGAASPGLFMYFYQSRLWIDQNLKKSLGH